jgi:hypothetical protein
MQKNIKFRIYPNWTEIYKDANERMQHLGSTLNYYTN